MTKTEEKSQRQWQARLIREGDHVAVVEFEGYAKATGYGAMDAFWDDDGDSIIAEQTDTFWLEGHPAVKASFAQGTHPLLIARMLHKMARMLEGTSGHQISNLGLVEGKTDYARRVGDGVAQIGNRLREIEEYRNSEENGGQQ